MRGFVPAVRIIEPLQAVAVISIDNEECMQINSISAAVGGDLIGINGIKGAGDRRPATSLLSSSR